MANDLTEAPERRPDGKFKGRISRKLRHAIELMTLEGMSRSHAAERAGMTDHGLYAALKRPHVRALMRQMLDDLREGEAIRAYFRQVNLGEAANSEDVKERANRWVAGCAGLAPVQKVDARHQVTHTFAGIGFVDVTPDSGESGA